MLTRLLALLAALVLVPLALVALLLALLQSPGMRDRAEAAIDRFVPGVTVEGLGPGLPSRLAIERVALADDAGTWLEVEAIDVRWRPAALLRGRVDVAQVEAARVALPRPPAPGEATAEPSAEPAPPGEPFALPEAVFPLRVAKVAVGRIELGAPVLGEAAVFALAGRLDAADGRTAALDLALTRLDRAGLTAGLDAELGLAERRLDLALELDERSGLLAALTGEPRLAPLTARLTGNGPLADWPGKLAVTAGSLATLSSDLGVALADVPRLVVDGRIAPGDAIADAPFGPLLADGVALAATVTAPPDGIVVEGLRVAADAVTLTGAAALTGATARVDLDLDAPVLAALTPLVGTELEGAARLAVALDGALPLPPGTVRLEGRGLRAGEVRLDRLAQEVSIAPGDGGAGDGAAVALTAAGTLAGLTLPAGEATFAETLQLDAAATLTPGGPFTLDRLALDGRSLALSARADGDLGAGTLDAEVELRAPDLAAFRPFAAAVPEGSARLGLEAALADGFARGTVDLAADGETLQGLPPAAQALVGPAPTLRAAARLAGAGAPIALERLRVDGALFALTGEGRVDPTAGTGALTADLDVPDLAPLGDALGQPLAGTVGATLDAEGGADDLAAEARVEATPLAAAGQAFERIALALTATGDPSRLDGALDVVATKPAGDVRLTSDYALTGERVDLADLRLAAPGAALGGEVGLGLAPLAVDGGLEGGSDDLAALGRWLDVPLAGALDVELALAAAETQTARLDAAARGLDAAGVALDRLDLNATAAALFATPRLDVRATVGGLASGGTTVERAEATVAGDLERLDVTLDAAGALPQPFELAGEGDVRLAGGTTAVTLTRLDGRLDDLPVRLAQPARLELDGATMRLRGLDLELDTGRLEGDATLGPERIDGRLELAGLRLERLAALGLPPFTGAVAAEVTLAGTRRAPVVDGRVGLSELRPADSDGPPAAIDLDWRLGGGRLAAELATDGFGEPALGATARLPVRFALDPFAFALPAPLPLDATLAGVVDLARVTGWYGLEARTLEGRLDTDLAIAGTAAAPRLTGGVNLADGRYVDLAAGVLLDRVRLDLAAEGRRLVLRELAATDGAEGRLTGEGAIDFETAEPAFDVTARLREFAVVQREVLFLVASGEAGVVGRGADLDVRGDFTVERGEVFLAGGGGAASFAALDVVERSAAGAEGEPGEPAVGGTIALDVGVDVPGRLFVRGRGLVSEWEGGIDVGGTAAAPRIRGMIEYRRGHFDLFDRRFALRRGEVQFTGASPPDPFLNVEAAVELPDNLAILAVQGPALDPELSISSEPPLPEDEIFARLLFDRDQAQLNALQALRVAGAVRQLQGGGPGALDRLRGLVGIDTLELGGETVEDASLKAGTYVSEDVFVEIERGLKPGSSGARVQIELTPRLNVETRVREDSTGSVGLRWSYDY